MWLLRTIALHYPTQISRCQVQAGMIAWSKVSE